MAEEKIMNEEVLDEEQLDGVAGGTQDQVYTDYNNLKKLGLDFLVKDNSKRFSERVQMSMNNLIADLNKKGFSNVSYTANWDSTKKNVYSIGGNDSFSQAQFWAIVNKVYGK